MCPPASMIFMGVERAKRAVRKKAESDAKAQCAKK